MVKRGLASQNKSLKKLSSSEREEILIENFVGLQKAMINLSMRFENLSENISKLLHVFELSARDYLLNKNKSSPQVDRELLMKINELIEQNKSLNKSIKMQTSQVSSPSQNYKQPVNEFNPQNYSNNQTSSQKNFNPVQGYQQSQDPNQTGNYKPNPQGI